MMSAIDKDAAIEIARRRAAEHGLPFEEPVRVIEHRWWLRKKPTGFDVGINVGDSGAMFYFTISARTGKISSEVMLAVGNKEAAIEVARRSADEKDWCFADPVVVIEHHGWRNRAPIEFEIHTSYGYFGAIAHFRIDAKTGQILREGYVPI